MDRKIETSLYEILSILYTIREEQGTVGWSIREDLADMLVAPPTEAEIRWFLDERNRKHGMLTTNACLAQVGDDQDAIDDIWYETAHDERPIAEFMQLWNDDGQRVSVHEHGMGRTISGWFVTPEEYR